jgi:cell division protein FtsI/penicillin-binding protein 2
VDGLDEGPSASLEDGAHAPLKELMRAVVTEGSGQAAADVPGLAGKTGTAEFGSGTPLPTHAWFIGFRNGVGFAILVEGGGVGGRVAAPIAARFAAAL